MLELVLFYIFSAIAIVSAILVITRHNVVHSAAFLGATLFAVAGIFLTLRAEFLALRQRLGLTAVLVTHDMMEALLSADLIAVMSAGRLVQVGTPHELLCNAAGVVTVNSTVGVTALHHGVPVKVLGNAVFDVAGLTCQAPLAAFWHDQRPPDPALMDAFLRALVGTTQVKGG